MIIDLEVISREFLGLADLTRTQALHIHKLMEVVVVGKNKDLIFATLQIVAPSFKDFNNSPELLIVSLIPSLGGDHFSREKSY